MKRVIIFCLFSGSIAAFLFSQSNRPPASSQSATVAPPSPVTPSAVSPGTISPTAASSFENSQNRASQVEPQAQARILDQYGKLPLSFEANHGQSDPQVKFLSRTSDYSLFLTSDEAVMTLPGKQAKKTAQQPAFKRATSSPAEKRLAASADRTPGAVLRMKLRHTNPAAKVAGVDELPGTSNYFTGNDPAKWRTNVPTYAKVKYQQIYSGIDLVYYGNQRQLEYDFIVAPGADPHRIAFDVRGAKQIRQNAQGDLILILKTSEEEIRWHKPVVYQEKQGARHEIAAHYSITNTNRVGFELAKYDATRPLYIDPLIYSTYLGGSGYESGSGIAVDSGGNAYVTGNTYSPDFPVTSGAFQTTRMGDNDVFVTKFNPTGSALVYSTYLGGSGYADGGGDIAAGIAVDGSGNAYVIGTTVPPTSRPQPVRFKPSAAAAAIVAVVTVS